VVGSCTADHCCNHVRHFGDVTSREDANDGVQD
jgi:hypothetical protein